MPRKDDPISVAFRGLVAARFRMARIDAQLDPGYLDGAVRTIEGGPFGYMVSYRWAGAHLDVLESDRMSGDALSQIDPDGTLTAVGQSQSGFVAGPDADADERERAERSYHEHNRRFYDDVRSRGLFPASPIADEP
jgi:hypothetical protein